MEKVLFYDKGYAETGKSSSIKAVFRELARRVPKEDVLVLEGCADAFIKSDIKGIIKYRGIEVGIESEGDPGYRQPTSVREFSERDCAMIVCACRTKGETKDVLDEVSLERDYTLYAVPHFFVRNLTDDIYVQMNKEYAESVVKWIDWWIDNK